MSFGSCEFPDVAFPDTDDLSLIDLVDLPVVGLAWVKGTGKVAVLGHCIYKGGAVHHGLSVCAEIDIQRRRNNGSSPLVLPYLSC